MIANTIGKQHKTMVVAAAAVVALGLCALPKTTEAHGWHGGWGWRGGWWAGPRIGIGFGYYPGYAYAPPVYYPPAYYLPPAYYYPPRADYAPTAYSVAPRITHRTVRRHVHNTTKMDNCPTPSSAAASQPSAMARSGY